MKRVRKEIPYVLEIEQREAELRQKRQKKALDMPNFEKYDADVKMNVNQILREQHNLEKETLEQIKREKELQIN